MGIKATVEYAYVGKFRQHGECCIRAAAVDDDNILRPPKLGQSAGDILFLIKRQDYRCNMFKHFAGA
jgi:hypothetical protein